jgi:hypothetical protein
MNGSFSLVIDQILNSMFFLVNLFSHLLAIQGVCFWCKKDFPLLLNSTQSNIGQLQ